MSDRASPKPGTMADFKARREAYRMVERLEETGGAAQWFLEEGKGKQAVKALAPTLESIEKNPHAARAIEVRAPGMLQAARETLAAAKAEAPYEVTKTKSGPWMGDGFTETKLEFGKSDMGHHYRMHRATSNSENNPEWSAAFATEKAAIGAGRAAQAREIGPARERVEVPQTPRGRHAEALTKLGEARRFIQENQRVGGGGEWATAAKHKAFVALSAAANTRTQSLDRSRANARNVGIER